MQFPRSTRSLVTSRYLEAGQRFGVNRIDLCEQNQTDADSNETTNSDAMIVQPGNQLCAPLPVHAAQKRQTVLSFIR